jgi:hypothetical protein
MPPGRWQPPSRVSAHLLCHTRWAVIASHNGRHRTLLLSVDRETTGVGCAPRKLWNSARLSPWPTRLKRRLVSRELRPGADPPALPPPPSTVRGERVTVGVEITGREAAGTASARVAPYGAVGVEALVGASTARGLMPAMHCFDKRTVNRGGVGDGRGL